MTAARTAERESPRATYQDVLDAPAHLVAEIINGTLHTHPRPAPTHTHWRRRRSATNWGRRSTADEGARADGGSSTSPSCT